MEESYETFEEELWPPRADPPPPQKPVRQTRRPEMYSTRKIREEMAQQHPRAEPKTLPRELSIPKITTLPKDLPIQNLTQIETPWENVTLNRCLFVAITILVLTSGFQKLHETMRGHGPAEEEETELVVRRLGALRHRGQPPEPETSLWEVMFWWLPDLDDDDEDDEEEEDYDDNGEVKKGKSKTKAPASKSLRNKPLPDKKLMKQREGKLKGRRAKKSRDEDTKDKDKDQTEEPDEEPDDDEAEEGEEEEVPKQTKKSVEKKNKKKTQKG
ncbi:junctional sarcoplasmic reticulum protein 1 isoform X3 [Xyrichtys novacula]|nr:junctional sarcoplasmic reticulum protein 1 isoform X3 [Xyrichtys novacula]